MSATDEELDRDWQPNGRRPQSTIARSFSQELMDIFRIENSVADLDEIVDKRKQQLNSQTTELEALEARIREMEQRLKGGAPGNATAGTGANKQQSGAQRPAVDSKDGKNKGGDAAAADRDQKYGSSRPGTARPQNQQAVSGALPPTPVASEDGDGDHDA